MCGLSSHGSEGEPDGVAAIASLAKSGDTVTFVGSQDTFDYNDFPIRPGHEEGFYRSLLESMKEQEVSLLRLDSLRENSSTQIGRAHV